MFMLLGLLKISPVITLFFIITMGGVGGPLYHIYNQCPPAVLCIYVRHQLKPLGFWLNALKGYELIENVSL